jgi:hypothetical protein
MELKELRREQLILGLRAARAGNNASGTVLQGVVPGQGSKEDTELQI